MFWNVSMHPIIMIVWLLNMLLPAWKLLVLKALTDCQKARGWPFCLGINAFVTRSSMKCRLRLSLPLLIIIGLINFSETDSEQWRKPTL